MVDALRRVGPALLQAGAALERYGLRLPILLWIWDILLWSEGQP